MKQAMTLSAVVFFVLTIVAIALYAQNQIGIFLTLAITFGTITYHLAMRLGVGFLFRHVVHAEYNYKNRWFNVSEAEQSLYKKLKVKAWKNKLPTAYPQDFNPKIHSWEEIAQAMCTSELTHEVNALLSFLPIFASIFFGSYLVFITTSVLAALFDLMFAVVQRYNRPRVLRIIKLAGGKYSRHLYS